MAQESLTAKYRPQIFSDVAGQEFIKHILSRASAEGKIAPAYLFSGTRGVGKTTMARIFAKAINCAKAPINEPCNECSSCRQITKGCAIDVLEIDGASSRKIDDVRRLKEDIGYAPLESKFKVFIIDEAHMLTREAFNALLKTLEEPPPHAIFILATTEPEKFPQTIISRCQQYVFKSLPNLELQSHLEKILTAENILFENEALNLIAKRGNGSVRDSMSLLAQIIAFNKNKIETSAVRKILGLANRELFLQLIQNIKTQNLLGINEILRQVLDNGYDLGFFLRELVNCWRNMFLILQINEKALPILQFSETEFENWSKIANIFSPAHVHACWQLTLEAQRTVLQSFDPGMALEMLVLNLAYLPNLLSVDKAIEQKIDLEKKKSETQIEPIKIDQEELSYLPEDITPNFSNPEFDTELTEKNEYIAAENINLYQTTPKSAETEKTWTKFINFYEQSIKDGENLIPNLRQLTGLYDNNTIKIICSCDSEMNILNQTETFNRLKKILTSYYQTLENIEIIVNNTTLTKAEIAQLADENKTIKAIQLKFNAYITKLTAR